jgi:hypothetical protein
MTYSGTATNGSNTGYFPPLDAFMKFGLSGMSGCFMESAG